jgi:predicted nucleic acid-binding protein
VIYLLDACALFNLTNGGVLDTVLQLPGEQFTICGSVRTEAKSIAPIVDELIEQGALTVVDDSAIDADEYLNLKETYGLGDGETECIAAALHNEHTVVFDDRAARTTAQGILGEIRVTGSIGLLRQCVGRGLLTREAAYAAYEIMKAQGGYLPNMPIEEMFPA